MQNREFHKAWEKPPGEWIKYNYDSSFLDTETPRQVGWIQRDKDGTYMGVGQAIGKKVQNDVQFTWIRRYGNKVADKLAKTHILDQSSFCFHNYIPIYSS
ncbi:hypothetical protein N665_1087s0002 [Sinapis alba]|nr:hypothetical protein N665_1087s0002 [Sinapis alba]